MSTKQNDETQSRWYMANKDCMATLCADHADAEQAAVEAQDVWPHMGPHRAVQLRESSGAWFTAADMATAAAQGFREGQAAELAAMRAGGGPVAWAWNHSRAPENEAPQPSPTPQADSTQSPAPEVGRVYLVATGESHEGEETYTRHDNAPPPLCDSECLYTTPQADSQPAPVLWVSPEQFANLVDGDKAPFGTYLPVRKTSAGKFTMPLFTASAPADSVLKDHQIAALVNELRDIAIEFHGAQQLRERIAQVVVPALKAKSADSVLEDAALLHYALADGGNQSMNWQDIYEDWSGEGHLIDALRTAYRLDAARKQGGA